MTKTRLKDLKGWPPPVGSAYSKGESFVTEGQTILKKIIGVHGKTVTLKTEANNKSYHQEFIAPDEETAKEIAHALQQHTGTTINDLGDITIETTE